MKWNLIWVVLIGSLLIVSCKSRKKVVEEVNADETAFQKTLTETLDQQLEFETISLVGKANIKLPESGLKVNANYRINMISDSLIWMRVSVILGVEVLRVLITPDSAYFLDKTQKIATISDLSPISGYIGFDASIKMLQDVILGNMVLLAEKEQLSPKTLGDTYLYESMVAGNELLYQINPDQAKLISLEAKNPLKDLHSKINYRDFSSMLGIQAPEGGKIEVLSPSDAIITFAHSKMEVNPSQLSTKFRIPSSYKKVYPE
ncbi:MAG: DUF4292 domain-containing protein [Bacteroidota bacterium]